MAYDAHIQMLFSESNFDAYDQAPNRYPGILQEALAEKNLDAAEVLAVSHTMSMLVVCTTGIFVAEKGGLFSSKKVRVYDPIPYSTMSSMTLNRHGVHGTKIEIYTEGNKAPYTIEYDTGGPVRPEHAAAEARRIAGMINAAAGGR